MSEPKTLVTGAGSGLGKHLATLWPSSVGLTRATPLASSAEAIVHCAYDRDPNAADANVELTERFLRIPHERFVLLSSCDVYSRWPADESSPTDTAHPKSRCEERVLRMGNQPLVLRATSLLGPFSRPSNLSRLILDEAPVLTLTADSSWNVILHEDVRLFIEAALRSRLTGVFNLAASNSIRVDELAAKLRKTPRYGEFKYEVGDMVNRKAMDVHEAFGFDSWQNVSRFNTSRGR